MGETSSTATWRAVVMIEADSNNMASTMYNELQCYLHRNKATIVASALLSDANPSIASLPLVQMPSHQNPSSLNTTTLSSSPPFATPPSTRPSSNLGDFD